jgi:hypothetical protein
MRDKILKWFFKQQYRFGLAMQLMVFINFAMMSATTFKVFGFRGYWMFLFVPCAFALVWLFGLFLDKYIKMQEYTEKQLADRGYNIREILKQFEEIKRLIQSK